MLNPRIIPRIPHFDAEAFVREAISSISSAAPFRVRSTDGGTEIATNLAGFTREQVEVSFDPEKSTINVTAGVTKASDGTSEAEAVGEVERLGFYNRPVSLKFNVPENINAKSVKSEYSDGVLRVTFSLVEPKKKPVVNISVS